MIDKLEDFFYRGDFKSIEELYASNNHDNLIKIFYLRVMVTTGKNDIAQQLVKELDQTKFNSKIVMLVYYVAVLDFYLRTRKLDQAEEKLKEFEQYQPDLDLNDNDIFRYYGRMIRFQGTLNAYRGNFKSATKLFSDAIEIQSSANDKYEHSRALSNRAATLYWLGRIELALEDGLQAFQILSDLKITSTETYIGVSNNIGLIYYSMNRPKQALEFFKASLKASNKPGNIAYLALNYHNLIRTYILLEEFDIAQSYLAKFKGSDQPFIKLVHDISKAMLYLHSQRISKIAEGQEILGKVIEQPVIDHQFTILAIFTAADYLLLELEKFGNDNLLYELHSLLKKIDEIGTINAVQPAIIQSFIIRSKLRLLQGDLDGARKLLEEGHEKSIKLGLSGLEAIIEEELRNIEVDFEFLSDHHELSLQSKLQSANFGTILRDIRNNQLITKLKSKEKPLFFIILSNSGMPLYSQKFDKKEKSRLNEFLISGFLTAVDLFGRETFQDGTYAEKLQFKESSILLKRVGDILFTYGYREDSRSVTARFDNLIQFIIAHPEIRDYLMDKKTTLHRELPENLSVHVDKAIENILIEDEF